MDSAYIKKITADFPYPISVNYKRLRSRDCAEPGRERLHHLLATAEAIARFLAFTVLAECRDRLEQHPIPPPISSQELRDTLTRPGFGRWINIVRNGLKWLQQQNGTLTCPEIIGFYYQNNKIQPAAKALDALVKTRNDINHDKIKALSPADFQQLCQNLEQQLDTLLTGLAFLSNYEFSFVDKILVSRHRRQAPQFNHYLALACGSDDQFELDLEKQGQDCMETQVMILKNLNTGAYLNLDPFYLYDQQVKTPDIYFFNGINQSQQHQYSPCKTKDGFNAEDCLRHHIIQQEIQHLINLFSKAASHG